MITLAPFGGSGPTPSRGSGTASSQLCSWRESVGGWDEYHEPVWEASRVAIASS